MADKKRYNSLREKVDPVREYSVNEAVALVKEMATAKFDETVELCTNLGVDPRHADQQVRGTVSLPHGTGKVTRVVVFAEGDKAKDAEAAGADAVGSDDLAKRIQEGWMDFDVALATPDMMRVVGRLGKVLGPRGLMPNPKSGSVTQDIGKAVEEFKGGKIEYRVNKQGNIHCPIGKASFSEDDIAGNLRALMDAIIKAKPAAAKGQYIKSLYISSTMSPAVRVNPGDLRAAAEAA